MWIHSGFVFRTYRTGPNRGVGFGDLCQMVPRQDLSCLVVCFAAAVLPVNYIALDFAVVLPNLNPSTAAWLRPLISTVLKISCFEVGWLAMKRMARALGLPNYGSSL